MEKVNVVVRKMVVEDLNFILASWLRSYRHGSYFAKRIKDKEFYRFHHSVCEQILARPSTQVFIACDPKDEKVIFGYLVTEYFTPDTKNIVHFTYVKSAFRDLGIAKTLIEASGVQLNESYISHWTIIVDEIIKKYPGMTYVPYLI